MTVCLQHVQTNRRGSAGRSLTGVGELRAAKWALSIQHSLCANSEGRNEWCHFGVVAAAGETCSELRVQQLDGLRGNQGEERAGRRGRTDKFRSEICTEQPQHEDR